jgi:hypothetical protein
MREQPMWKDYRKMIAKKAWEFSRKYGIEHAELCSEGNLVFVYACRSYDGSTAAFSTYLTVCLNHGLSKFCRKQKQQTVFYDYSPADYEYRETMKSTQQAEEPRSNDHLRVINKIHIQQSIANLPQSGCNTMRLLMAKPKELGLDGSEAPRIIRGALKRHIHSQGVSWAATWQTIREIKNIFEEVA